MYGIPEFRLPKAIVRREIEKLEKLGVEIKTDMVIGKILSVDELMDMGYEAIFIGSGAGLPNFMGIDGESLIGVYSANEYLTRTNLMKAYLDEYDTPIMESKSVAVVGGGNVAMEEIHHAKEEEITLCELTNPLRVLGNENGEVCGLECIKMELGEPDESGRRRPIAVKGSEFVIDVDTVIMSIGTSPNPLIRSTTEGLETNKKGCFIVDENMETTRDSVYAGGDAVTGAATVILAMGAGKTAAAAIDEKISNKTEEK